MLNFGQNAIFTTSLVAVMLCASSQITAGELVNYLIFNLYAYFFSPTLEMIAVNRSFWGFRNAFLWL